MDMTELVSKEYRRPLSTIERRAAWRIRKKMMTHGIKYTSIGADWKSMCFVRCASRFINITSDGQAWTCPVTDLQGYSAMAHRSHAIFLRVAAKCRVEGKIDIARQFVKLAQFERNGHVVV